MRALRVLLGVLALLAGGALGPVGAGAEEAFAPVDQPGPALSVPPALLRQSLVCTGNVAGSDRTPVLLVPGTTVTPNEHFSWNYMRSFDAMGWPYCSVTTPKHAMEDMQVSGEYVVFAIRTMAELSGRRIAILGGSQGGSLPRWALRFWPDTRALVEEHVGLAPTNHGGDNVRYLCNGQCAPALWQQASGSAFMRAMNSGQQTFPGIDYTEVYSHQDQFVTPAQDDTGASSLHGGGGRITNVALQDICPAHVAEHIKAASYDAVGYALAIDALTHDGPADPARIDGAVCAQEFPPGVDPATFPTNYAMANAAIATTILTAERVPAEPPLRCYATDSCQR